VIQLLPALLLDRPRPTRARGGYFADRPSSSFLLPVEVVVPKEGSTSSGYVADDLTSTSKLKVAKWENAFENVSDQNPTLKNEFTEGDIDRFYLKVPMPWKEGEGTATVKIKTDSDPENEIEVTEIPGQPGVFRTKGLILVSNDVDDDIDDLYPEDGKDEGLDDVTHKAKLGETVTFTVPNPNGADITLTARVPARAEIDLTVRSYNVPDVRSPDEVGEAVEMIKALLSQIGIRVNANVQTQLQWPVQTLNAGTLSIYDYEQIPGQLPNPVKWADVYKEFSTAPGNGRTLVQNNFQLYFVRAADGAYGIAITREDVGNLENESNDVLQDFHFYVDNSFVSEANGHRPFTHAHELLHTMLLHLYSGNGGHSSGNKTHLIRSGTSPFDKVNASKRITKEQEDAVYEHIYVKPIQNE